MPETAPAPVATPAAPASTPSTAATGTTPAATPEQGSATFKAPSKYGSVPRDKAAAIFASLDAKPAASEAGGEESAPEESPAAPEAQSQEAAPRPAEPAPESEAQSAAAQPKGADELPQSVRDALKQVTDPKLRKVLADGQFILRDLSRAGVPYQTIRQFIQDAPAYLTLAPTKDVLESISRTAQFANTLGSDFMTATPESLNRFAGQLVESSPGSFVAFTNHLLFNAPGVAKFLGDKYGAQTAQAFRRGMDAFFDKGVLNVASAMKKAAESAPEDSPQRILGEVADEMLKFLSLDPNKGPEERQPDERDAEMLRLRAEVQQAQSQRLEQFQSHVFNSAGNEMDGQIQKIVDRTGFNEEAKRQLKTVIGQRLYQQLLTNPHIASLKGSIDRTGRGDKQHADALINLYLNAGNRLLPQIAQVSIQELSKLVRPNIRSREARVAAQVQNRDVGASGPPTPPRAVAPRPQTRPRNQREAFQQILAAADARADQEA